MSGAESRPARAVVTDFITDDLAPERRVLDGVASVEALGAADERQLAGRVEDAAALMVYHAIPITRLTIERLRACRVIVRCGVGYDNIDHAYAAERGIPVVNVPDYGTEDVADHAIGLMLALARGIALLNSRLRAGLGPWSHAQAVPVPRLRGRVFGVVGLGRIGSATALRARALGMDVAFHDPYKPDGYDKVLGVRRVESLEELLAQSYVVSLHCPLTPETHQIIDARTLGLMPRGGYLVNTSRGGVVDVEAVPPALESGQLAGAALDVLPVEPPTGQESLLRAWRDPGHAAHHRLILTPHAAFYSEEGWTETRIKSAEAVRRALLGQPIRNMINHPIAGNRLV
jgi:D-3-phosphoglycerate dehydrogenase/C-terminal binding protein